MSDTGDLPAIWGRPEARNHSQGRLFATPKAAFLAAYRISPEDVERWRGNGWVTFPEHGGPEFAETEEWELRIVAKVSRSGLSEAMVSELLRKLPRPVGIEPERLAFSFEYGWVVPQTSPANSSPSLFPAPLPQPPQPPPEIDGEDLVEMYRESLVCHGDADLLRNLADEFEAAAERAEEEVAKGRALPRDP